jgi:hypothetical protein
MATTAAVDTTGGNPVRNPTATSTQNTASRA